MKHHCAEINGKKGVFEGQGMKPTRKGNSENSLSKRGGKGGKKKPPIRGEEDETRVVGRSRILKEGGDAGGGNCI